MKRCLFGPRTIEVDHRIALRGVRVGVRVSGMSQKTTIEQTYVNLEPDAIEAVYTFPLPESAAVCGFEVITGERLLTGQVEEAERAIDRYEDAINAGDAAYMAEQNRPDVFTVRCGNLKPRQAVTVRLTYVCPLERNDKSIRLSFPTTIAPRYVSTAGADPLTSAIDGDALNPPHVLRVPYGLTFEADVDLGRPLRGVFSPTHAITAALTGTTAARVGLAGRMSEMDRDLVLDIQLHAEHEPIAEVAPGPGGANFLAVTFVPEFDVDDLVQPEPVETVFVLDCSGSMQGDSIRQAVAALELCLRSLSVGDTFNVCRFGSTFELMRTEPLHYSQYTLDAALDYVRHSRDLGGTELHAALDAVLSRPPAVGKVRQVILLTDGQVSNEPAVIELARSHRAHNRLFTFGIGTAASASLVKGLARATGGAAEFITGKERIDEKVLRTFGRLSSPVVSDVSIDWDGCDVQTLAETPPVFDGDLLTVFGRAPGRVPRTVTLACRTRGGQRSWRVPVRPATDDAGVIATMWARRTIQSLEEVNGTQQTRYRYSGRDRRPREVQTLVDLSKEFNLLCSLTTFIAIEHRSEAERNEGRPELRRVPVMLAKGWGGIEADDDLAMLKCVPFMSAPRACMSLPTIDKTLDRSVARPAKSFRESFRERRAMKRANTRSRRDADDGAAPYDAEDAPASSSPPAPDPLHELLACLTAEGSFKPWHGLSDEIRGSGRDTAAWRSRLVQTMPAVPKDAEQDAAIVRTAMSLMLLRTNFADREPLWRRAAGKALAYLAKALGTDVATVNAWLREVEVTTGAALPGTP